MVLYIYINIMAELLLIDKAELKSTVRQIVKEVLAEETAQAVTEADFFERMNRKEAAKFLGVGYQTMGIWTRKGLVKQHGTGRKAYYLRRELMNIKPGDQWKQH